MRHSINRRTFVQTTTTLAAGGLTSAVARHASGSVPGPSETIVVGVMGMGSRGPDLGQKLARMPGVRLAYVCDVDSARTAQAVKNLSQDGGAAPEGVSDFRRILDDPAVDALFVTACNHWHAPASWLACAAGKHVYVEKPCSHTPREGEALVAAARRADRVVQMGNQRRSWPKIIEAIQRIHDGAIGTPYLARSWYNASRGSIGRAGPSAPPAGLDFDLWQGPATRRPFHANYLHYNWHWFWHWGNGELGNNGIHMIDLCRWGLGVDFPTRVVSQGGRYWFDDDQETPDTHITSFEFGDSKLISWEGLSGSRYRAGEKPDADVVFWGEKGTLTISGGGYVIRDPAGKELEQASGDAGDAHHLANFFAAIRGEAPLASEIEQGHRSTLLCHLGNISYRVGRSLDCDPANGHPRDPEADGYWTKEYAPGWEIPA